MPGDGFGKAFERRDFGLPLEQLVRFGNFRRGVLHVGVVLWLIIDGGFHPQMFLDGMDHGVDAEWRIATAEVEDFITANAERGDGSASDVINVGEVAGLFAIAIESDGLAAANPLDETEGAHVRAAGGTEDGEVAENRHVDAMEMVPGEGERLGGELGGGVGRDRAGDVGGFHKRHCGTGVKRGGGGHEVTRNPVGDHEFEEIQRALCVGGQVNVGIDDAGAHAGACGEVDDGIEAVVLEELSERGLVLDVDGVEREVRVFPQGIEAMPLEADVIVVVEIIDPDDFMASIQ